jgi:undecaprenyl phosphate N,N'-diacetylbacillosamine 1-phosphate transferase
MDERTRQAQKDIRLRLKRSIDVLVALLALIVLAVPAVIVYCAIRLDSRGPGLFVQQRLGQHGVPFSLYKFRTMEHGAETRGSGIYTSSDDPRITRVGRLLRKTSLDELPQLVNVLRGDMSLVGPRPPLVTHPMPYSDYPPTERRRFNMAPGITGLAQVTGRNALSWPQRIEIDVKYVDNWSLLMDVRILARTVTVALGGSGVFSGRNERSH